MAEAGPSSSSPLSNSTLPTPSPSPQRSAHIHFPVDHAQVGDSSSYGSLRSLGLGPPPSQRQSGPHSGTFKQDDRRRRVRSVDASNGLEHTRNRDSHLPSSSRRTMSFTRKGEQRDLFAKAASSTLMEPFSDEYDLSREDPGVLEDVQRALRAKARREARMRTQSSPLRVEPQAPSDLASVSSAGSNPNAPALPPMSRLPRTSGDSEIDFSPSVSVVSMHPVPSSSDGGLTLDWSGPFSDDGRERRWSLSRGKRKSKDVSISFSQANVDKQRVSYEKKLDQIRAKVKPLTKRKVTLITSQLERKYELLSYNTSSSVNLLNIVQWYRKQLPEVRSALDDAEPSTWMKHLWDRQGHVRPRAGNSTWSPTALVMAEYVKAHLNPRGMDTIPENEVTLPASPNTASLSDTRSPSTSTYSWTTPRHSLEAAISRKRTTDDAQLSFEPLVESGRDSVGPESRRSSDNYQPWKTAGVDSAQSSVYSMISKNASPNSSRRHLRDIAKRLHPRGSDEALSSARNSISENSGHSASEDGGHFGHQKMATLRPRSRPTSLRLEAPTSDTQESKHSANGISHHDTPDIPSTATQSSTVFPSATEHTPRPEASPLGPVLRTTLPRRGRRRSLPSSTDIFAREREKHRRSANEHKEREEYELKAQALDDATSQNLRIRNLLQRVCASIREYDSVQAGLSGLLEIPYSKLPSDVVDAFLHDPSAVTAGSRNMKGWRAAEDIHDRIRRQRETLQAFLQSGFLDDGIVTPPHKVFDDPIKGLMQALDKLAAERQSLAHQAEEVTAVLKRVKVVQASVKKDYNDTLGYTSLVYPELSQIAALEESYRNQFQQFWDIGLDALTFLLDTVTPFWRNYGKVIGEDVQDFLIIPWYRNEFTGEPKRYAIQQFPRRSLRHWVGLLFLSFVSVTVTVLQARAAVSLTVHIHIPWITNLALWWMAFPLYSILLLIQWCAVLIELSILVAQSGVMVWWLGWSVNLFT